MVRLMKTKEGEKIKKKYCTTVILSLSLIILLATLQICAYCVSRGFRVIFVQNGPENHVAMVITSL